VTKIRTAYPSTAEHLMRQQSQSSDLLVNIWFKWCRKKVFRAPGGVFCLVVVKCYRRHDLDDAQSLLAHNRAGQLLAGDISLAQQALAIAPVVPCKLLGRMGMGLGDDEHPDA